jgi:hypothetical protein
MIIRRRGSWLSLLWVVGLQRCGKFGNFSFWEKFPIPHRK